MILLLQRERDDGTGTRGTLTNATDGKFLGYTMEPSLRTPEHPAILPGTYTLAWTPSNRLKKETLEVCMVPAKEGARKPVWKFPKDWRGGIRIHSLNYPEESLGCIGVGLSRTVGNFIGSSRIAVGNLEKYVREVMARGEPCYLRVVPAPATK